MSKIKVTAGEGRSTPLPRSLASGPGATLLILKHGDEVEVDERDAYVIRALDNGDLVRVTPSKKKEN